MAGVRRRKCDGSHGRRDREDIEHRVDIVRAESDLMRSPYPADIVGRLEYRVVAPTRRCGLIPGRERSRNGDDQYLRQPRRIIKILHAEIAEVIDIM